MRSKTLILAIKRENVAGVLSLQLRHSGIKLTMDKGADYCVFIPFSPREVAREIKVTISVVNRINR